MARIGLDLSLIIVAFGVVSPFFIFKLAASSDFAPLLALAVFIGLAYGAAKAEYPWYGNGIAGNAALMAASALPLGRLCGVQLRRGASLSAGRRQLFAGNERELRHMAGSSFAFAGPRNRAQ